MINSYLLSIHNALFSLKPSKATRSLFVAFFVFNLFFANTVFAQNGPNCPSGICIGPGTAITSGSRTILSNAFYSSIIVKGGETLIVRSGVTLYVGQFGTPANMQVVDFQNNSTVVVEPGAILVVNGLLNNSNNSNGVTFNGTVTVTGNVTAGNGSTIVGAGTLDTTGTIITDNSGSIFGSNGDCITGPCSGSQLNCSGVTNTISGNQTICSGNTPATFIGSSTVSPATYQWQMSTTNGANFVPISGATSRDYSPGQLNTTTYYRRIQTVGGCAGTSSQVTVVVTSSTSAPAGSSSQSFCSGATVANLSATGTAIKWYAVASGGTVLASSTILTNNSHYYASQTNGCESTSRLDVTATVTAITWTGSTNTSWFTPTNWSCGSVPTAATDVVIPNVTTKPIVDVSSTIALANTLTVESGSSLTVTSNNNLKVTDKVTNNGGTITFEDSASLVQINNVANTGNITYKRLTNIRNTDYTYWSSPVAGYTLGGVSQNKTLSDKYYSYSPTINNWQQESATTLMTLGLGYIIRGPEAATTSTLPPPPGLYETSFVGVPNNGNISVSGNIADRSYLLGNPYPSAISADKFLTANASVLNGTLYFWTHATPIGVGVSNPGTGTFAYSGDDYAVYNATGGVGAAPPDLDPVTSLPYPSGSKKPNGFISVGQGFFASTQVSPSASSIVFNNSMREAGGTTLPAGTKINEQFFKTKNPVKKASIIEKNRVWLNLSNSQGAFKQALIGYLTDATNEFDSRFDGESFDGNEYVDFYSVNQDKNLTIQGRALPFDKDDEVPLGFRTTIKGDFTINIDQVDGLLANQSVFIEDKLTNTVFDLKSGNYTFNTLAGTFDDRFVLRYTDKTLSLAQIDKEDGILVLYSNNYKTLIIHNNDMYSAVNAVALFNITGQNISNWEVNDSEQTNIHFPIKNISSGVYIVKVKTTKGESSKKIIVR